MIPTIREFALAMGSSLPASIVAKATVIAAFGLLGTRLARRSRAAVRHVLLAATFGVLLLLPVASIVVPPVLIGVPTVRMSSVVSSAPAVGGGWILPFMPPGSHPAVSWAASRPSRPPLSLLLVMGWLAGVTLALIPMIASLWKIRYLRRSGLPWADGRKVIDKLSLEAGFRRRVEVLLHEELPGPIASGMWHPTILFPPDAQVWGTEDLDRAAVHELEHLRRGDVVTHCLARVVCAAYWFHPLVWAAWRQLVLEAERSCDDAVIARSEATAYADQLVGLARRLLTSGKLPVLALANRSDLVVRVKAVLDGRQRRGRAGPFVVVLGCVAAVVALTMSPLRTISESQSARAQGAAPTVASSAPLPSFEVATIKLDRSSGFTRFEGILPGRFTATHVKTKTLIAYAYNVRDFEISGGPAWINSSEYDIAAKPEGAETSKLEKAPWEQYRAEYGLLVQSLLAERFKLKVSHAIKELPVYALVVAKNGPKLTPTKGPPGGPGPKRGPWIDAGRGQLNSAGMSMADLADTLSLYSDVEGRKVLDQTGLTGKYDIKLQWTPMESQPAIPAASNGGGHDGPQPDSSGPSIFTAIQGQLGLKLDSQKGPVPILVIEHVERPSEN